jgi:hypothetical protein
MIVPSGSPIWSRAASMENYGGHVDKIDYGGIGAVNARTDVTAAQLCRLAEDAASMAMVAQLFWLEVSRTTGGFDVLRFRSQWRTAIASYAGGAPLTDPVYEDCVAAIWDSPYLELRIPTSATDRFGVTDAINPRAVFCDSQSLATGFISYYIVRFLWSGATGTTAIIRGY